MPGENGLSFMDYIRHHCEEPLSHIPLIAVSACVFDSDRELARAHGASDFVPKPFKPSNIVQTIRDLTTSAALNSGKGKGKR